MAAVAPGDYCDQIKEENELMPVCWTELMRVSVRQSHASRSPRSLVSHQHDGSVCYRRPLIPRSFSICSCHPSSSMELTPLIRWDFCPDMQPRRGKHIIKGLFLWVYFWKKTLLYTIRFRNFPQISFIEWHTILLTFVWNEYIVCYLLYQRRFFENLGSVLTFAFLGTIISCVTMG